MAQLINSLPESTLLQGSHNRYSIKRVLGQGTFGITYLATTEMQVKGQMGSFTATVKVAVKEFFMKDVNGREQLEVTAGSQGGYFEDYKRKFLREADNLSRLQHSHIVKVLEAFEANNTAYFVMEYLEGGSLDELLSTRGALPEAEALTLARQIGSALECMHQHRMLHLDLKPSNVMLRATGEAVLIDFGLSKQFDDKGMPESSTSLGGGTVGYAPIEQTNYQRGDGLPVTMDVYAFGATLYKMLTGECPPEASDVLNDGLPIFVLEKCGVSEATIAAIEKAMFPIRKKRFQSIGEALKALAGNKEASMESDSRPALENTVITPLASRKKEHRRTKTVVSKKPFFGFLRKYQRWFYALAGIFVGIVIILWAIRMPKDDEPSYVTFTVGGVSFKMICVEGGTFTMGATSEQGKDARWVAGPAHRVKLSDYLIGETEVTQDLWEAVMGTNPSKFKGENRPVEQVSWEDCQIFIMKLNAITGEIFRLPTEAEWEFAARGGNRSVGYKYSGNNMLTSVGWCSNNSEATTHYVKLLSPNELGIYDMSGNVWEWCQDRIGNYKDADQINPTGVRLGRERVYRGGSWGNGGDYCSVSFRGHNTPDFRRLNLGFRLALSGRGREEGPIIEQSSNIISSQSFSVDSVNFNMIYIEGGRFYMGATSELESEAYSNEKPVHRVTLSSYYLGETEVTQALWEAVMGSNPSDFKGNNRPVERVSWFQCNEFIKKLNSLTGCNFRLPTEAEWEFAARGGNMSCNYKYSGSNKLSFVAWYADNDKKETHPVKTKSPNELGLYDMSGNVREWCQDNYHIYSSSDKMNPVVTSGISYHMLRGGSWDSSATRCRVSSRDYYEPYYSSNSIGLRLAL